MKFTIDRDVFKDAVAFSAKLLPARSTLPVLMGVKITAEAGSVEFASFDFEVSSKVTVQANVEESGSVLLLGPTLNNIAAGAKSDQIVVETTDNAVVVQAGRWQPKLPKMPLEEYPAIPTVSGVGGMVRGAEFTEAVAQVSVAASREDVTPVITGVMLEVSGNRLTLIATDRYRVSIKNIDFQPSEEGLEFSALVPARTLSEVGRMFAGEEQIHLTLSTEADREQIAFTAGDKTVTTVLIKGNYPPVRRLFPAETPHYAVVNSGELVEAIKHAQFLLERESAMRCTFAGDELTLDAAGGTAGSSLETIDIVLTGDDIVLSIKPQFLLDGLAAARSEFVRIAFTHSENTNKPGPILLSRQTSRDEPGDAEFQYLLQPNLLVR